MLITAKDNVYDKLDGDYRPSFLKPNHQYYVVGIADMHFYVVTETLDPALVHSIYFDIDNYQDVNKWAVHITDDSLYLAPKPFDCHPYFFEQLHDANLEVTNVYMRYLGQLFGTEAFINKVYDIYMQARNDNKQICVSYWLKEWMESLFGVQKAIELREFSKSEWQDKLLEFLNENNSYDV